MQLRLSLHEVISKSARALRALNFPAGSDTENGENIGWLEARGLPGLQILFEEIINAANTPSHSSVEIKIMKDTVQFSGGNQSAFHFAQSAVDFAENGMNVNIKDCRFPLLIKTLALLKEVNCSANFLSNSNKSNLPINSL